jgi:hypothetical protein
MTIHASPQLNNLMFVLIGEKFLQADEDMAFANGKPYERLGRRMRDLSDLIEQTAGGVGRALPPQVGNNYVRAMHMFLDSGGVNYLKDFADQLDSIGQSRTKSSMDIMESKWQIIAELVRLLIELLIIAVLSAFTGGSASSQAAVAKARSRVAILTLMEWLMKKTHLMPSITEAIEEAFTTFAVRLAMMLGAPKGRRPNGFDWSQIVQDGVFGAFTGLFHGLLTDLGKGLKNNFKNIFNTHNPFKDVSGNGKKFNNHKFDNPDLNTKPNPKPTPTPNPKTTPSPTPTPHVTPTPTPTPTPKPKTFGDKVKHELGEDFEHFVTEGGAETLGEIATASIFGFPIDPLNTFLGGGLSSVSERHLGQGAGAIGNKFNFNTPAPVNTLGTADVPDDTDTDTDTNTRSNTDSPTNGPSSDSSTTTGPGPLNTASNNGSSSTTNNPQRTSANNPPTESTDTHFDDVDVKLDGGDVQSNVPQGTTNTPGGGNSSSSTPTSHSPTSSTPTGNTPTRSPEQVDTSGTDEVQGGGQQNDTSDAGGTPHTANSGTPSPVRTVQQQPNNAGDDTQNTPSGQDTDEPAQVTGTGQQSDTSDTPNTSTPAPSPDVPVASGSDTTVIPPTTTTTTSTGTGTGTTGSGVPTSSGTNTGSPTSGSGTPSSSTPSSSTPSNSGGNPRTTTPGRPEDTTSNGTGNTDTTSDTGTDSSNNTGTENNSTSHSESGTDSNTDTNTGTDPAPSNTHTDTGTDLPTPVATTSNSAPPTTSSAPDTAPAQETTQPSRSGTATPTPTPAPVHTSSDLSSSPAPGTTPSPTPEPVVLTPSVTPNTAPEPGSYADARAEVAPSERSITWVDPVSRPIGADGTPTQYVVRAGFDVRQFSHDGGPVTDLTVTYQLTGSPHLGSHADGVHQRLTDGVRRVFNTPGHRLRDGSLLHVTVVPAAPGETAHLDVTLTDPADGIAATHHSWPADISDTDLAHEVGHQLGLRDESGLDPAAPHRSGTSSLMGDPTRSAPPTDSTDLPYEPGGLRPHHLDLIGGVPAPEGRSRAGPARTRPLRSPPPSIRSIRPTPHRPRWPPRPRP